MMWRRAIGGALALGATFSLMWLFPLSAAAGVRSASPYAGVLIRPVLCAVPPYDKFIKTRQPPLTTASCGPSMITSASMVVSPSKRSPAGYTYQTPQPALILEGERTTSAAHDDASKLVLLGGLAGSSVYARTPTTKGARYVLGPAVMTSRAIASATATERSGHWVVDWTTTSAGSALWDRVAQANFHLLLAFDVGGVVVSAPIIEPTNSAFASFKGHGEVSGDWSQTEASNIAAAMQSGG